MGTLYLVSTPIGNLEDISARALRTLREAILIAAEDTRQTSKLLNRYGIQTPLTSYFEHNKRSKLAYVLTKLEEGNVALVSDAGTPALNDPGYELVRAALSAGHPVSPIPGPSAPIAALVASGLPTEAFLYLGYLPRKTNDRHKLLEEIAGFCYTLVFLETPHRLNEALEDLEKALGDRQVAVARELTKLHEEIFRGSLSQAFDHYTVQPARGELTLVVAGCAPQKEVWPEEKLRGVLAERLSQGSPAAQIASRLAAESGWPRRKIYNMIPEME